MLWNIWKSKYICSFFLKLDAKEGAAVEYICFLRSYLYGANSNMRKTSNISKRDLQCRQILLEHLLTMKKAPEPSGVSVGDTSYNAQKETSFNIKYLLDNESLSTLVETCVAWNNYFLNRNTVLSSGENNTVHDQVALEQLPPF